MLEKGDLVSIVIPAYNTEKYIKPMIESLKAQTYRNLQVLFNILSINCMAVVTSHTYNSDGVMFEYTQSRHRPDYFSFIVSKIQIFFINFSHLFYGHDTFTCDNGNSKSIFQIIVNRLFCNLFS